MILSNLQAEMIKGSETESRGSQAMAGVEDRHVKREMRKEQPEKLEITHR